MERTDPVSGNKIPPGGTAKGVRDDIPIMASEGEYVIPANVVRHIGVEKLERMVAKAKEEIGARGEEPGPTGDDELPFDPAELDSVPIEMPMGMAEGGMVTPMPATTEEGFTGVKPHTDSNGKTVYVPYFNGEPLYDLPPGFSESKEQPGTIPQTTQTKIDPVRGGRRPDNTNRSNPSENERTQGRSPLAGDPNDWSVEDFVKFGRQRDDFGSKAIKGMISMMPGGKLAVTARDKYLNRETSELMDQMLDTGLDLQGNPLSDDQKSMLSQTRTGLIEQMGNQSGLNLAPMTRLGDAFKTFSNFISGNGGGGGEPRSSVKPEAQKMLRSSAPVGYTSNKGSDKQDSRSYSLGSDMGRDPSRGPSPGSMASGGLYKDGGLITRRKKT